MPTYLVHGFRWPRGAIRIHIALYDLDDAAAEWIVAPASAITLLNSFYTLFDFLPPSNPPMSPSSQATSPPTLSTKNGSSHGHNRSSSFQGGAGRQKKAAVFNDWSVVKLLEQYDLADETCASQPYAYVADYIVPIPLSVDIAAETIKYDEHIARESDIGEVGTGGFSNRELKRKSKRVGWFDKLRDKLAKDQPIGWYIVVVGDEDRDVGDVDINDINEVAENGEGLRPKTPRSAGLRGFFGRRDKGSKGSASDV